MLKGDLFINLYATLIMRGIKTIEEVPEQDREAVLEEIQYRQENYFNNNY